VTVGASDPEHRRSSNLQLGRAPITSDTSPRPIISPLRARMIAGNLRCRWHGARGGRPNGIPEHPHSRAARLEGRRRWVDRMREAKARGEITRFPNGARARHLPPLSKDPIIRRAQRIVEAWRQFTLRTSGVRPKAAIPACALGD